jgi:CrcB protein
MLKNYLLVGFGGALGSMFRYFTGTVVRTSQWPMATFLVNIVGSFILGMFVAWGIKQEGTLKNWILFAGTGFCGGFTTFSAFTVENLRLLQESKWQMAVIYILSSILLGIIAAFLGFRLAQNNF